MEHSVLQHPKFFNRYVNKVEHGDLNLLLENSYLALLGDLKSLEPVDFSFSYQPEKWSIAKLMRHCIDTEIIFGYRALCIARNDHNPIMSFDENKFADASESNFVKEDLLNEMALVRKQQLLLYKSFDTKWLIRSNKTESGENMSLISVAYIIIGHWLHHKHILATRYNIKFS